MKKLALLLAPLILVSCLATEGLEEELTAISNARDTQLVETDAALKSGEVTPAEWVAARDEIYERDREAREAAAERRSLIAGEEARSIIDLLMYALFGAGALGGLQVARKGVKARKESQFKP